MGRRLRTDLPQTKELLTPNWSHLNDFAERDRQYKGKQKEDFDRHHRSRTLPPLPNDSDVSPAATPRSYAVDVPTGHVRRNRTHIIPQPTTSLNVDEPLFHDTDNGIITRSRSGVTVRPQID